MSKNIMVVDNHLIIREGLKLIFESNPNFNIAFEASNGQEVIKLLKKEHPDLILLDIKMENIDGFQVMAHINQYYPEIPVVILSTFDNPENISKMLSLGAKGYLLKDASTSEIFNTIKNALTGNVVLQKNISQVMFSKPKTASQLRLSDKELQILEEIAKGMRSKDIAIDFNISERTVKFYLTSIYNKLGVSSRAEAISFALKNEIVNIE